MHMRVNFVHRACSKAMHVYLHEEMCVFVPTNRSFDGYFFPLYFYSHDDATFLFLCEVSFV